MFINLTASGWMHKKGHIHRGLASNSILFNSTFDFGNSRHYPLKLNNDILVV